MGCRHLVEIRDFDLQVVVRLAGPPATCWPLAGRDHVLRSRHVLIQPLPVSVQVGSSGTVSVETPQKIGCVNLAILP
jgi:hypothetical protein